MKRFYIIFFLTGIGFFALMGYSTWWFLAGVGACMLFIVYRFYLSRLEGVETRNEALEQQVTDLHEQLDRSIRKEQRTSRIAEEARQVKQRLLSTISHEIRTPMNGIMGMVSFLAETSLDKEQREYTENIRYCGEQLLSAVNLVLVNDLLKLSKSAQEEEVLENKEFDLRNCLEEVLDLFAGKVRTTGLELLYEIDVQVPALIIGDNKRLRQILTNLIENAVKFTRQGEVFVGVRLLRSVENGKVDLAFEVRDTGIGIPAGKIENIFKGFPHAVLPGKNEELTGLGLVICKKLVEMMDGWIEVRSEPDRGSTFTFAIRVMPGRASLRMLVHHEALEGRHVLIVNDNISGLALLSRQLEQWKIRTIPAGSGRQALEILSRHPGIDLVITDDGMPEMSGIQLAAIIHKQSPGLPIILLGGAPDELSQRERGFFASVLSRPVKQHMLRDSLLNLFSRAAGGGPDRAEHISADFAKEHPLRILVAEDNPINQKVALKLLGKLGYTPELVSNGKEVLDKAGQKRYDLILMDVLMPEMDGWEATRMLRLCLEVQPVIIAMTANTMLGDRNDCMQAGMDDYISKPIDLNSLVIQLRKWSLVINGKRPAGDE